MLHYFVYGKDGKRGLFLTTKQAELINRFTRSFFDAQDIFLSEHARRWDPATESIRIPFGGKGQLRNSEELDAYNKLTKWLNRQHWVWNKMRLSIREEDMMDDFLIRKF
jgi:hypothetical protein